MRRPALLQIALISGLFLMRSAEASNRIALVRAAQDRVEVRLLLTEPIAGFQLSVRAEQGTTLDDFRFEETFNGADWMSGSNILGDSVLKALSLSLSWTVSLSPGTWTLGSFRFRTDGSTENLVLALISEETLIADQQERALPLESSDLTIDLGAPYFPDDPPARFVVQAPYPNPFNPSTQVRFTLMTSARVRVEVFDIIGRRVANLLDEERPEGSYVQYWDGKDNSGRTLASGMYLIAVAVGQQVHVERVVMKK